MRRMQHESTPLLRKVYEACLRDGTNIKSFAEFAEKLSLPEKIPTPPAQSPAEPERILPAEPERIPPAEPERIPPAEPERIPPAEPENSTC
ncbi:hypothetical protein TNCV_2368801 [Trichonephila clavipes]|nr:hypothetical protein TNCV_2368801 [Trichonephila clavipes]